MQRFTLRSIVATGTKLHNFAALALFSLRMSLVLLLLLLLFKDKNNLIMWEMSAYSIRLGATSLAVPFR